MQKIQIALKIILLFITIISLNGCLTPYDNEFYCKGKIEGTCGKSILENYKNALKRIDDANNSR